MIQLIELSSSKEEDLDYVPDKFQRQNRVAAPARPEPQIIKPSSYDWIEHFKRRIPQSSDVKDKIASSEDKMSVCMLSDGKVATSQSGGSCMIVDSA